MSRRFVLALGALLCCRVLAWGEEVDLDRIKALANIYFRDSTEIHERRGDDGGD